MRRSTSMKSSRISLAVERGTPSCPYVTAAIPRVITASAKTATQCFMHPSECFDVIPHTVSTQFVPKLQRSTTLFLYRVWFDPRDEQLVSHRQHDRSDEQPDDPHGHESADRAQKYDGHGNLGTTSQQQRLQHVVHQANDD